MRSITATCLAVGLMALGSCSPGRNPPPTAENSEGLSLMVMYDCHGDCEEPAVGFGGHFYAVACDGIGNGDAGGNHCRS